MPPSSITKPTTTSEKPVLPNEKGSTVENQQVRAKPTVQNPTSNARRRPKASLNKTVFSIKLNQRY